MSSDVVTNSVTASLDMGGIGNGRTGLGQRYPEPQTVKIIIGHAKFPMCVTGSGILKTDLRW